MAFDARPLRLCVHRRHRAGGKAVRIWLRVPSDVAAVEEAVEVVTRHCLSGAGNPEPLRFRLQTALAEALANAVLRGNHGDAAKSVHLAADLEPEQIRIYISDEGNGFDHDAPRAEPTLEDEGGRGLFLLRALVDALHYNERGNALCMTLRRR